MGELSVFITGANGFVGRAVVRQLAAKANWRAVCLVRRPAENGSSKVSYVIGDLVDTASYRDHLIRCDAVLHLAAVTGKSAPQQYFKINCDATILLAEEAARSGVNKLIFVSSIAAKFNDSNYHYGQSKLQAEDKLKETALDWIIVRPTMILGRGSPIEQSLSRLATMPVVPMFGDGKVRVQPVFVGDLAECLVEILEDDSLSKRTMEVGGPQTVSIEDLIQFIRHKSGGRPGSVIHLPIGPIAACLRMAEPLLRPVLPFTAGQLASFFRDGVAESDQWVMARHSRMKPIKEMLDAEA